MDTHLPQQQPLSLKWALLMLINALGHSLVCFALWWQGSFQATAQTFLTVFSIIWGVNLLFLIVIFTKLNWKLTDPTLILPQVFWSQISVILTIYFLVSLKAVLLLFVLLGIVFGAFRLNTKQLITLVLFSVLLYAVMMIAQFIFRPNTWQFEQELIMAFAFAFVVMGILVMTLDLSAMRSHLQRTKMELESSLIIIQADVITDELTGVRNRRYILSVLEQQTNIITREKDYSFSIALFDIDQLQDINNQYGHVMRDAVLKSVVKCIQLQVRKIDYFARFGGEEFILVAPFAQLKQVKAQVERLSEMVENTSFDHILPGIKVTLSVGITEYQKSEAIEEMLRRAEEALRLAKKQGRNQTVEL